MSTDPPRSQFLEMEAVGSAKLLDDDDDDEGVDELADFEFARAQVRLVENSGVPEPLSIAHVIMVGHV